MTGGVGLTTAAGPNRIVRWYLPARSHVSSAEPEDTCPSATV